MSEVYLSRDGIRKLQEELKELKTSERPAVRESLQRAREFGDLSENAEWESAMEEQRTLTARAMSIEEELRRADLLENAVAVKNRQ